MGAPACSVDGRTHKLSLMGWAGHDERKLLDGRVALEMPLKSCSVVQNKSRLVAEAPTAR